MFRQNSFSTASSTRKHKLSKDDDLSNEKFHPLSESPTYSDQSHQSNKRRYSNEMGAVRNNRKFELFSKIPPGLESNNHNTLTKSDGLISSTSASNETENVLNRIYAPIPITSPFSPIFQQIVTDSRLTSDFATNLTYHYNTLFYNQLLANRIPFAGAFSNTWPPPRLRNVLKKDDKIQCIDLTKNN